MAKKTRKQKQRAAARRTVGPRPPGTPAQAWDLPSPGIATQEVTAEPATDDEVDEPIAAAQAPVAASAAAAVAGAPRRRIERLSQAAPARPGRSGRGPANAAAMFQPLDTEDAAIPFDRVPYVPSDLRRVAIMAGLMVVLIIIAAVIVTHVVQ